ncbi:MAG TPA: hypothetical protein VH395_10295 [Jatrophihabitantaceae bacterium]
MNVREMQALVTGLVDAEQVLREQGYGLIAKLESVSLDGSDVATVGQLIGWVGDELVTERRRLALAQALAAATPGAGTVVQFDDALLSTKTPAQAAADARVAARALVDGDTKTVLELLTTEGYDPYFAAAFATAVSPRRLSGFVTGSYCQSGALRNGVDAEQYDAMLTALGQTLSLASRAQGDLRLGLPWQRAFIAWMTDPPQTPNTSVMQRQSDMANRSALMLIMSRGMWDVDFLRACAAAIQANDGVAWWQAGADDAAVAPNGVPYLDPAVAMMTALARNPAAGRLLFSTGGTTDVPLAGGKAPVNALLHWALLEHGYDNIGTGSGHAAAAVLALQAAIGGEADSPIATDVATVNASLKEQKTAWDAMPWYQKWGHTVLDVIGTVPVVGDLANVPNGVWYAFQHDWTDAGISAAGMIPFLGDASLSARVAEDLKAAERLKALRADVQGTTAATAGRDWAELSGVLREATTGKGNFGLGSATQEQADAAGRAWVGDNAILSSDRTTWVSEDGLRQFRAPSFKPSLNRWQANFESREVPRGPWQRNGHLDITDPS